MNTLPTTAARTAAMGKQTRYPCIVLALAVDKCANRYGSAPCTGSAAVGNECYNTYATCQDKTHYVKTTQTINFVSRGTLSLGQGLRPYLLGAVNAPAVLDFEAGLAPRSNVSLTLADETDNDADQDPYWATRPVKASGTYWGRFLARNKNYYGRVALLRKGFVATPWNWDLFLDELYIIDSISMEGAGTVKMTLKDPLKLVDNNTIPLPTSGAISADLKAIENTGTAVAGGASTITLIAGASAVDSYYNGMEVYIYANTGAGQRRVVASYVGATRVATLTAAWSVVPDATSAYQVGALKLTLDAGKGAQYTDPATSGKAEYIRIGSEIIRYTAKAGDVLSWTDTTYRAQFGTTKADQTSASTVQLCRAFIDQSIANVLTALLTENKGVPAGYLSATIANECASWYGSTFNITACLSAPEQASSLITEILQQIGAVIWWSAQTKKVEMKAIMPNNSAYPSWTDTTTIIQGSMSVKNIDSLRITEAAISYAQRDATSNLTEPRSFLRTDVIVNQNAESTNEYGDIRPQLDYSRWFGAANSTAMVACATRKINRLYNPPKVFAFKIDHKDYTEALGSTVGISSYKSAGVTGAPKEELCFITKIDDAKTHVEIQARSANFGSRYAYIAPNGQPDYGAASSAQRNYAYLSNGGVMSDGSPPYLII